MGVFRDRLQAKLRFRSQSSSSQNVAEGDNKQVISESSPNLSRTTPTTEVSNPSTNSLKPSSPSSPPEQSPAVPLEPLSASPDRYSQDASSMTSLRRRFPRIPRNPDSTTSERSRSTLRETSAKVRRFLRNQRTNSTLSTDSGKIDDVPEPAPQLLSKTPVGDPVAKHVPPDTPLTDGFVAFTVPHSWSAVRADDAIYLLSGQGVGFVKAVAAVDACEILLEVGRLSIMSEVRVRSSPVWEGREACVEYNLVGGFGMGIARFQDGFDDAGAVVFAVCAPNEKRQLVLDTIESIRRSASVVKIPESSRDGVTSTGNGKEETKPSDTNDKCGTKNCPPGSFLGARLACVREHYRMDWSSLKSAIIVCGHAVYCGGPFVPPDEASDDSLWSLQAFQSGEPPLFIEHVHRGVVLASKDPESLLIFSGGQTRKSTILSEAQGYYHIAQGNDFWKHHDVKNRVTTEEFARDSYDNVLFGIARFMEAVGRLPDRIILISWTFKSIRLHSHASSIRWPMSRFLFEGVGVPSTVEKTAAAEAETIKSFLDDPTGYGEVLGRKKAERNPFTRQHGYGVSCPALRKVLAWRGPGSVNPADVPWACNE